MRPNFYLMKATVSGALGGLLFGFDTAVIAGAMDALTRLYHLTDTTQGITVFTAVAGTVVGAMSAGAIGQKLGGRETLRITAVFYVISAIGCMLAWNWDALLVFRFLGGLGIGASSVLGPVYITELAPAKWRGRMVGTFQVNVVIGILLAYASNFAIRTLHLGAWEWRVQLGVAAIPAVLFLILLFGIPRSPRWSVSKDRIDEAMHVLKMMGDPDPAAELADIKLALKESHAVANEPVFQWKYRYPLFLAITIGAFNQLAGINAILYYLNNIFASAGFSQMSGDLQSIAIGATNLVFTLVGMTLIDRLGRKTLLLIGAAGCAACLGGVAYVFLTNSHQAALLGLLVVYIAFFAVSQGAVIWVYIGEVFPNVVRNKGQSVGNSSHWIMNAAIALVFPILAAKSGGAPFVFFAVMTLVQFVTVLFFYPETKGQTLEALQRRLTLPDSADEGLVEPSIWSFRGRIPRRDYWIRLGALALLFALIRGLTNLISVEWFAVIFSVAAGLFGLATQVKRWHDLDLSGGMVLLNLTVVFLPVALIWQGFFRGTAGPNRFGADPTHEE
jgi:sugar porter (SP) family MFS transporter